MDYHFRVRRAKEGGYWAQCVEIEGCVTEGDDLEELTANMEEALNVMLDEPPGSKVVLDFPRKRAKGRNIRKVAVAPSIAFAFVVRHLRLRAGLTQAQAAKKLGFANIYSYQRLENSKTANPRLDMMVRLQKVFPELDLGFVGRPAPSRKAS